MPESAAPRTVIAEIVETMRALAWLDERRLVFDPTNLTDGMPWDG